MKVVILAGGLGTRLSEETANKPKPMIEIGSRPILWHIMNSYTMFGFKEFIIALGYKGEVVKEYFMNFYAINNDMTLDLKTGNRTIHSGSQIDWTVHLIDTGLHTQTGGRLKRLKKWIGNETFMMTYGDGLSNINIRELLQFHRDKQKLVTVSAVRPPARFGELIFEGSHVRSFSEKPQTEEGWINGGFFVIEPEALETIQEDCIPWEGVPLETLAANHELVSYKHHGFWQPMDTLREWRQLEKLWQSGQAPWVLEHQGIEVS